MSLPLLRTPVRYLLSLQEVLQNSGVDISRVAQVSEIHQDILTSYNAALTDAEFERYIEAIRTLTQRGDLGFELGRRIKMNSHGTLGYGLVSSSTVHDFMAMIARHFHLVNETWSAHYRRNFAGGELFHFPRTAPHRDTLHFAMETMAVAFHNKAYLMLGERLPTYDIHLSMPRPEHAYRYKELEPVRYHFHENALPSIRIVMSPAMLDTPLQLGNPEVMREIEERCAANPQPSQGGVCWSDYVSMMLREAPSHQVKLEELAKHIQVSARTIDRNLKKEGVGYRELSDKVRFERARHMLGNNGRTMMDVAEVLGFSDAANFSRAFKRVVGVSPGEYRQGDTA